MDYYFNFVIGKIKRGPPGCPVPIEINFVWILSGPNGTAKTKSKFVSSNIANLNRCLLIILPARLTNI